MFFQNLDIFYYDKKDKKNKENKVRV